jgi:hypothetical protein
MKKTKNSIILLLVLAGLSFVYLLGPVLCSGRPLVIDRQFVPEFWGGLCSGASGSCKICCVYPNCLTANLCSAFNGTTPAQCLANVEKNNVATGFSCDTTGVPANSCTKSNIGTCSKTYDCIWFWVGSGTCAKGNYRASQPSYLTCI